MDDGDVRIASLLLVFLANIFTGGCRPWNPTDADRPPLLTDAGANETGDSDNSPDASFIADAEHDDAPADTETPTDSDGDSGELDAELPGECLPPSCWVRSHGGEDSDYGAALSVSSSGGVIRDRLSADTA